MKLITATGVAIGFLAAIAYYLLFSKEDEEGDDQ